jgi:hypothetical protein
MPSDNFPARGSHARNRTAAIWLFVLVVSVVLLIVGCDLGPTDSSSKQRLPTPTPLGTLGPNSNIVDPSTPEVNSQGTIIPTRPRPTRTPANTPTPLPTRTPTNTPTFGTPIPTHTSTATLTPFASPTAFPSATQVHAPPTVTPRATDTATATATITPTPTSMSTEAATAAPTETAPAGVEPVPTAPPLESPLPLPGFLTPVLAPSPSPNAAAFTIPAPELLAAIPDNTILTSHH